MAVQIKEGLQGLGDIDASAGVEKGKWEEKVNEALVTMERATVSNKGKQIVANDDFSHGPIDLSSLSPIQALKLATLAQAKAHEDMLKSHSEDKD